ncbi:hypothetical protein FK531_22060 [Rhodococcus spelaei]|uniref:Uncharacterized protein n=1 Tax=Rhodococcus spelaei TaxID=2546320 RepID=A0A541AZ10_9NOCA|nr:hypothetical protein [Rhodococcus spelaei]TQF65306.1 hypothetical protein FK531_22060 [Rhodococcus spelaei]
MTSASSYELSYYPRAGRVFFDEVRYWTYDNHSEHTDLDLWIDTVRAQAQVIYAELSTTLPNYSLRPHKITEIADECAAWTWGKMHTGRDPDTP